jgi:hypothetical protein
MKRYRWNKPILYSKDFELGTLLLISYGKANPDKRWLVQVTKKEFIGLAAINSGAPVSYKLAGNQRCTSLNHGNPPSVSDLPANAGHQRKRLWIVERRDLPLFVTYEHNEEFEKLFNGGALT